MTQLTKEESVLLLQVFVSSKYEIEGKLIYPLALALQKLQLIANEQQEPQTELKEVKE